MTTTYGQSAPAPAGYPADVGVAVSERIARWRPLVSGILVLPHLVLLLGLGLAGYAVVFVGWFAALFTGKLPAGFANFMTGVFRYQWRVTTYQLWMRKSYPTFSFKATLDDDGTDPAWLRVGADRTLSRLSVLFRAILIIPHIVALLFVFIAAYVAIIIGFFAVLITGRWPAGLVNFVIGALRWSQRVNMWYFLLTDPYPPFSLR